MKFVKKTEKKTDFEKKFQCQIDLFCQHTERIKNQYINYLEKSKMQLTTQPSLCLRGFCRGL